MGDRVNRNIVISYQFPNPAENSKQELGSFRDSVCFINTVWPVHWGRRRSSLRPLIIQRTVRLGTLVYRRIETSELIVRVWCRGRANNSWLVIRYLPTPELDV